MNHRLTAITAVAVLLASLSLSAIIDNDGWLYATIATVIVVAIAGTLTRLAPVPAAVWATVIALLASAPMLGAGSWWLRAGWLAIGAVTAATVTRARGLPVLGAVVTYLGSMLLFLNLAFAAGQSLGLIIPTTRSLRHLANLADQGWALRNFAPPVPATRPLELLVAAGVGLVAVVADVIAVRLRSPALAGLPLLVLFCVPVTTTVKFSGLGAAVAFCLAITGYLALLAADGRDRLRVWGRLVTVWQQAEVDDHAKGPDTRALAAAGRRIGLAAVCVAVIAPLLIPDLHPHKLFAKHPLGNNGNPVALPDPLVAMRAQLNERGAESTTVLTYTAAASQLPYLPYLQLYVLNLSPKGTFTLVPLAADTVQVKNGKPLKPAPGLSTAATHVVSVRTNVTVSKGVTGYSSKLNFLPVPYAPTSITTQGSWREDPTTLMLYSGSTGLGGLKYAVISGEADPSKAELDARQTGLPARVKSDYLTQRIADKRALTRIAQQATSGATTAYQKAFLLQTWLSRTGGFTYSLNTAQLNGPDSLLNFLTKTKAGFCQQFAYAMTILARLEGIPSRIAVGYTAGHQQTNGTWQVTEADAHAWPELYFKDIGWLRFEPTPAGNEPGQGTAVPPVYGTAPPSSSTGPAPSPGTSTAPAPVGPAPSPGSSLPQNLKRAEQADTGQGGAIVHARHANIAGALLLALAILVFLGAIAPGIARRLVRLRRWRRAAGDSARAHAAWQELRDDMTDYGLASRPSESPRALARRIGTAESLDEPGREALNRIATAEERASYASAAEPGEGLRADVTKVRRSIASTVPPGARWRARLFPPSMLVPVRGAAQQALDVFGWMDAAGEHIRHRMRGSEHA
ncbi:MAG TPA: transglutaminaseTgpA domain-containing protein [Streptosporangiaceae bacterium]|jgi:transglutaminase-like putative cysteine protease